MIKTLSSTSQGLLPTDYINKPFLTQVGKWLQECGERLLPQSCLLCQQGNVISHLSLCQNCYQQLPWLGPACPVCANAYAANANHSQPCGQCLKKAPPFHTIHSALRYATPIDHWVAALKFQQKLVYARVLSALLLETLLPLQTTKPDVIIPMPLHSQRLCERGYNQSLEIARPIAKKLAIPLALDECRRILPTAPQASMPAAERRKNVRNAFWISPTLKGKRVVIVDDVVTTTSTIRELARVLRLAGAIRIDVWCCARTA